MKIRTSREMKAPASAVWHVLGEQFGEISNWVDAVVKSTMDRDVGVGATRTCDIKAVAPLPAGQIVEELTHFDRDSRSLTFVIRSGVPGFMRFVENAWVVEDLGDGRSKASSVITIKLAWWAFLMAPIIKIQLGGTIRGLFPDLETAAAGKSTENFVPAGS